jgi:metal-sulfur cluster biosynthetic enzyme
MVAATLTEQDILELLEAVLDPCATAAGVRGSIVDMGLVRRVEVTPTPDGADVSLAIGVTEPTCIMYHSFARDADRILRAHPGVSSVRVELADYQSWTELDMSPRLQAALAAERHRKGLQVHTTGVAPSPAGAPVVFVEARS